MSRANARSINAKTNSSVYKFKTKSRQLIQDMTREVLLEVGERLIQRSPIGDPSTWNPPRTPKGYKPGLFINNWQVGIGAVPEGVTTRRDPSASTSRRNLAKLGRWPAGKTYFFGNNVPYAAKLEYGGHSPQVMPGGMVGMVSREWRGIVRDVRNRMGDK